MHIREYLHKITIHSQRYYSRLYARVTLYRHASDDDKRRHFRRDRNHRTRHDRQLYTNATVRINCECTLVAYILRAIPASHTRQLRVAGPISWKHTTAPRGTQRNTVGSTVAVKLRDRTARLFLSFSLRLSFSRQSFVYLCSEKSL